MRLPPKPGALETNGGPAEPINRDPSYPDRARLDSDVRAFLRPTSSPWIVFDRDSRADDFALSALRVGAVFASSPSLLQDVDPSRGGATITDKDGVLTSAPPDLPLAPRILHDPTVAALPPPPAAARMFPESVGVPEPTIEPSTVVVATDVVPPTEHAPRASMSSAVVLPPGLLRPRRQVAWVVAACAGLVVVAGGLALGRHPAKRARAAAQPQVTAMAAAVLPGAVQASDNVAASGVAAPEAVTPPAPVAEPVAPAPTLELDDGPVTSPAAAPAAAETTPKRFGKLTIKADGKVKNVWFDGKRMLGTGTRSFLVFCGMHTVAVNEKIENKDIEIPCNGEYVVSK